MSLFAAQFSCYHLQLIYERLHFFKNNIGNNAPVYSIVIMDEAMPKPSKQILFEDDSDKDNPEVFILNLAANHFLN